MLIIVNLFMNMIACFYIYFYLFQCDWNCIFFKFQEVAGWLRTSAVENIVSSTSTLQSLAKLLGEISNIVIKDAIGQEVSYD